MLVLEFTHKTSNKRAEAITKAIDFAWIALMPRVRKPVYINITPVRKLAETQGVYGDCFDEGDREFTIRIDVSLPINEMMTTLLHEMVHVQQYVSLRMIQKCASEIHWEGVAFSTDVEYDSRPWEIEAHAAEKQMTENYFGQRKHNTKAL